LGLTKCGKRHRKFPFRERKFEAVHHLCNDLEAVVFPRHPVLAAIKGELMQSGALGALLSGSGACVFGLFADSADARKARRRLSTLHGWRIFQADMIV
jgi:4-diphosphocytidyl-2-C-methyl-D-erythritol kinase